MDNSLPTIEVPVNEIFPDPDFNCRGAITPFDVIDLIQSIDAHGLQQPIVIQPYDHPKYKYRVVMGHRRHKAFEVSKRKTIPCIIKDNLNAVQARTMNLIENLARRELTFMQEAKALEKFMKSKVTMNDIAKLINKSVGWVQTRFTALKLPPEIQAEINAGFITQAQIKDIAALPSLNAKYEAIRELKDAKLRGDKRGLKILEPKKKKNNPTEKRTRTITEIFELQDIIRDAVGNNLSTIVLGWAAGLVNTITVLKELKDYAHGLGRPFEIPINMRPKDYENSSKLPVGA